MSRRLRAVAIQKCPRDKLNPNNESTVNFPGRREPVSSPATPWKRSLAYLTRRQSRTRRPCAGFGSVVIRQRTGPRRTRMEGVAVEVAGIRIWPEEKRLLREAGRFRVIAVKDIAHSIYGGDERAMRTDLNFLEKHGLIVLDSVPPRNDGRWRSDPRIEIVTLTRAGEKLLHATGELLPQQLTYHGLVKPREAEHDSQIYRAYLKEAEHIEKAGGINLRVELDFELKSKVQKAIYAAQKADPSRSMDEIKREAGSAA